MTVPCRWTLGVDLGLRGAAVLLLPDGRLSRADRMPVRRARDGGGYDPVGVVALVRRAVAEAEGAPMLRVVAEAPAHVRIRGRLHAVATASLFLCAGLWHGAAASCGLDVREVAASQWQAELLAGVPGAGTKARAAWLAGRIDPRLAEHDGLADAACLAEWGRRNLEIVVP